jgi:hypothetical protein
MNKNEKLVRLTENLYNIIPENIDTDRYYTKSQLEDMVGIIYHKGTKFVLDADEELIYNDYDSLYVSYIGNDSFEIIESGYIEIIHLPDNEAITESFVGSEDYERAVDIVVKLMWSKFNECKTVDTPTIENYMNNFALMVNGQPASFKHYTDVLNVLYK